MINAILDAVSEPIFFLVIAFVAFLGAAIGMSEKDRIREWAFGGISVFCLAVAAILHKLS